MAESGITSSKKAARKHMLAVRDALGHDARKQFSAAITEKLFALPEFGSARTVAAYVSFGSEFDSAAVVASVLGNGKRLLLPRIERARRLMIFHVVTDAQDGLIPGPWGIREPDPGRCARTDLEDVDLMLVPGLAFTKHCERLGYGGGFYDSAIESLPPHALKVAAAFSAQIVDTLDAEPHDRRVDMVVTENASFSCDADQGSSNRL